MAELNEPTRAPANQDSPGNRPMSFRSRRAQPAGSLAKLRISAIFWPAGQFAALLTVSFIFYGPALGRHFFWSDDIPFLLRAHRGLQTWADIQDGHFAPVFRLWAVAQLHLFGLHSPAYQVVSIFLVAITSFLMLRLLLREGVSGSAALMAAVILAVSPVNLWDAIWFTMQAEYLMALFSLAALLLLPDRPAAAAVALFLSFGSFGAGPLLMVPFCLYCIVGRDKILFKPLAGGLVAAAVFACMRLASGAEATRFAHSVTDVRVWPVALGIGFRQLAQLNSFNWWIPAGATAAAALLALPPRISWRRALSLLVPLSMAIVFMLGAYWLRSYIDPRHLMMPLLAALWMVTAVICSGRVSRIRETLAVAVLAALVFYPFWLHTQKQVQAQWEANGKRARRYSRELEQLLAKGSAMYDTHLIGALSPYFTVSEYAVLIPQPAARNGDAAYPWVAELPVPPVGTYTTLAAWQALNYDAKSRDFYVRYYPAGQSTPRPPNLLPDGWLGNGRDLAVQPASCMAQAVTGVPGGAYSAVVFVRSHVPLTWGFTLDGQVLPLPRVSSGSGRYELLSIRTVVPDGSHQLGVRLCSSGAGTADADGAALFHGFPDLPAASLTPPMDAGASTACAIDGIDGTLHNPLELHRNDAGIVVKGWAVDPFAGDLPRQTFLTFDGRADFPVVMGMDRPDVAAAFHNDNYRTAGFVAYPPALLPAGDHVVSLKVLSHDGTKYWTCAPGPPRVVRTVGQAVSPVKR